jgi:hypothetical protein
VTKLRRRVPSGFTIVVEQPFVVIGNGPADLVQRHARSTVRWAVDGLKRAYFAKDPKWILDIWLFNDKQSYEKYALALFGEKPTTPYGYYSSAHRALVMNISTGGGTLVHEIVHPFIEANFPACPPWFNEGLGSLYEQAGARKGEIWGFTNWRLAGLQQAIRRGRVPSFKLLTSRTSEQFYGADPGTNYSQARYLLYYLQERGLLHRYYHAFLRDHRLDPTGYRTLSRILGVKDMIAFKRVWEKFVLALKF